MSRIKPSISKEFIELSPEPFARHIYIETSESEPSSKSMAAVAGNSMKIIPLEGTETLADVHRIVVEHYKAHEGNCALYGRITGFTLHNSPDETVQFSVDGHIIGISTK